MSIFQQITSKNFQVCYKNVKFKEKLFQYSRYFSSKSSTNQQETYNTSAAKTFVTFQDKVRKRRSEAKKSIIVQVQSAQSFKELYSYCSSFGNIKQMFHYSAGIEPMHFILVEFQQIDAVKAALSSGTFIENNTICPTHSQFLWFRAGAKKFSERKHKKIELSVTDGLKKLSSDCLKKELRCCESISDQINTLYDMSKLTDLESRLRFLTARQIEMSLAGMFPNAQVLPFGSSVNGYGKIGCDLDVVLTLDNEKEAPDSRLIFHCKGSSGVDRSLNMRNLETIGDILHLFLPGCTRVRKILQARVPIIKYYHQFTDVECDLSMSNVSGVHMSDFLYMMGALDPRVRPLVFTVRRWAKDVGLTNSTPGRWITNFSLTLLVLSFLQRPLHSPPILPALNTLVKSAGSKDSFVTEEGVNCTFLRDIDKLHHNVSNTESLESLLCEFFEYYSQFDFKTKSVCLNEAVTLSKPDHSPLYIVNPLERGLNVSKNVSLEELDRFREEVKNAAWLLQSTGDTNSPNWGLLSILGTIKHKSKLTFNFNSPKNHRLMHVKELFVEGENDVKISEIEFKNNVVKKQVEEIKKENVKLMKSLSSIKGTVR
ncbi:poly(A) RNA polymerase, mitochondrial [Coccinella septempunctata]|uniref:poly(A) RNA polymerase, mitochondrial n=1 Tax=Coccinella septempunctata TaxID=41139 RepID=UPI001D06E392|nr:poly(A) RNA polymerase, mitochondrial [Coccinella septempunctata]